MTKPRRVAEKRARLHIKDLECLARVGVHDKEKRAPQKVRINLELKVKIPSEEGDRLENVVCYDALASGIRKIALEKHCNLVETLAQRIVNFCFEDSRILAVRVLVEKPHQLSDAASVGAEIEEERDAVKKGEM